MQRDGLIVVMAVLALAAGFACKGIAATRSTDRVGCVILLMLTLMTVATYARVHL